MSKAIEKLAALFCIIVFLTFMVNHGHIDFSGVDWVKEKTSEALNSEEGKQYVNETKEISKNVFHDLFYGLKEAITGKGDPDEAGSTFTEATLLTCLDGDTIKVKIKGNETTVRLIGIDAPEYVNPDKSLNTSYGEQAFEYINSLLENVSTLYLEYDVSQNDSDGRALAYVWISKEPNDIENNMINAILVKNGYAKASVYLPNNKYSDVFMDLNKMAKESNAGLWKYKECVTNWEKK